MKEYMTRSFVQKVWNEGNIDIIPEYIASRYSVVHDPGDPWNGMTLDVAGFQNRVSLSRAIAPDQVFEINELFENGDSTCITWLWSGTHLGEIAGIPASGKKLHMSGATVYLFDNNRISGHWQVADRMSIFRQIKGDDNESVELNDR